MRREVLTLVVAAFGVIPIAGAMAQSKPGASVPPATTSASSASAPASAVPVGSVGAIPQQVVWLRSGSVIRGEVVEYVPNTRVVLQLATGEVRTIPWDEVARASWVPSDAPSSQPAPTASIGRPPVPGGPEPKPETKRAAPAGSSPGILLHLEGDRPGLRLEVRPRYGEGSWIPLCDAPCGSTFDVHRKSLRVTGPGARPSTPFHIDAREGEETLEARAGSDDIHRWGQRSLVAGIGLALAGGLAYGLGHVEDEDAAVVGGVVGMALGGIGIVVAIPLLGASGTVVRNGQGERVGTIDDGRRRW
jgi:hypothetical protein